MTHASVGCPAFGDIPMLPTTTPIGSQPWDAWEKIAHDDTEMGVPGYYTVRFPDTGVTAELTATTRTGVGRFHYPRNGRPALFHVRSGGSLAGNSAATIEIGEDNTTITGSATSRGFCGKNNTYTVYFAMKFSRPFTSYGTWDGNSVYRRRPQRGFEFAAGDTWSSRPARWSRCGPRCPTSVSTERGRTSPPRAERVSTMCVLPHRANGTPRCRGSRWPAQIAMT